MRKFSLLFFMIVLTMLSGCGGSSSEGGEYYDVTAHPKEEIASECPSATGSIKLKDDTVTGKLENSYKQILTIKGQYIEESSELYGYFYITDKVAGEFNAKFNADQSNATGEWRDYYGCYGTFNATR
jgi:hypothetical protein